MHDLFKSIFNISNLKLLSLTITSSLAAYLLPLLYAAIALSVLVSCEILTIYLENRKKKIDYQKIKKQYIAYLIICIIFAVIAFVIQNISLNNVALFGICTHIFNRLIPKLNKITGADFSSITETIDKLD